MTLISEKDILDTQIRHGYYKIGNYRPMTLIDIDVESHKKKKKKWQVK